MTQEDKELLLKDLCVRLPYRVKVRICDDFDSNIEILTEVDIEENRINGEIDTFYCIDNVKPYLRPMSSMTEEEKGELKLEQEKDEELFIQVINKSQNGDDSLLGTVIPHYAEDWANRNHFDYRGLIEKGLALEAPKEMYNTK